MYIKLYTNMYALCSYTVDENRANLSRAFDVIHSAYRVGRRYEAAFLNGLFFILNFNGNPNVFYENNRWF